MIYSTTFAAYLAILGTYSATMILFGRWLAMSGLVIEEIEDDDDPAQQETEATTGAVNPERWMESITGERIPRIDRIHVIPIEDPVDSGDERISYEYLHCASINCWCNPTFADCSDQPEFQGSIVNHNAMTGASAGWVNIGENLSG